MSTPISVPRILVVGLKKRWGRAEMRDERLAFSHLHSLISYVILLRRFERVEGLARGQDQHLGE